MGVRARAAARATVVAAALAAGGLALGAPAASAAVSFAPVPGSPFSIQNGTAQNPYPETIVSGDFNGDGKPDLATANTHPNQCLSVLLGTGGGALSLKNSYDGNANNALCSGATGYQALAAGDLNHDGKLDLVDAAGSVVVDLGQGDGTFTLGQDPAAPDGTSVVALADLNGDGKLDLVEAGRGFDSNFNDIEFVATQLGNGDGTFQAPVSQTVDSGSDLPAIGVGNFTADAKPDVVVVSTTKIGLLAGSGDGTFQAEQSIASQSGVPAGFARFALATADFNGDGKLDLAVGEPTDGSGSGPAVRVFLGDGQGGFTEKAPALSLSTDQNGPALSAADFDADGHRDLAVAINAADPDTGDPITTVSMLGGNGNGTFQPARTFGTGMQGVDTVAASDLDGDGKSDLAVGGSVSVAGTDNGRVAVLRNVPATAPSVSTGAASGVTTTAAKLAGTVTPGGEETSWHFEYGTKTSYGSSTAAGSLAPSSANHSVSASLSGLSPYTTYHYRLVASNGGGSTDGSDRTFTTGALKAEAQTDLPTNVTRTTASLTGSVNPHGAPVSYHFEFGRTTSYGSSTPAQSAGSGSSSVTETIKISGLRPGTVYHYRIVVTGPAGTVRGYDQVFYTPRTEPQPADSLPKETLSVPAQTVLQRSIGVTLTCAEDCQASAHYLSLALEASGSSDAQFNLTMPIGGSRQIAAGHSGTFTLTLPLSWRAWIADVLDHGGLARLTANIDVIDPHGQTEPYGEVTLAASPRPAAAAHAAATDDVVPSGGTVLLDRLVLSEHPRPHHWQVTISGRQTTTWHVNNDHTEGACTIISHGNGKQIITFDSAHPVKGYIGLSPSGVPVAAGLDGSTPLDLPVDLQIDRQGSFDAGVKGDCHGIASGGGGGHQTPDCGKRTASTLADVEWLGPRDLHASQDANYELLHPFPQLYRDCPFDGLDNAISALDLWPAHDPDFPPDLVLTNTAQRHIVETIRGTDHETLFGGYANTQVIYNVTLQQLDCPPPLSGGLSAACVDDKAKQKAQAEVKHYQQVQKYDEQAIHTLCHPKDTNDAKSTGIACLIFTGKDGYDSHQEGENQAIANDPPDARYRQVARVAKAGPGQLPKGTPAPVRALVANQHQVLALDRAFKTTINRVTGAYQAKNKAALRRQNRAAVRYARRLAGLLSAQVALLHRAKAALLRILPAWARPVVSRLDSPATIQATKQMAALLRRYAKQNA